MSYDANLKVAQCFARSPRLELPRRQPVAGEGGGGFSIQSDVNGNSELMVNGVGVGGPAHTAAAQACGLSAGHPAPVSEAQKQGMFAKAHCIRTGGVPDTPDPKFGANRGILLRRPAGVQAVQASIVPDSPTAQP